MDAFVEPPKYRVYSPGGVAWATAIGSPVAGGIVLAVNYWKWGKKREAWEAMVSGVVVTAGLFALAWVLPANVPSAAVVLPQIFGAYAVAQQLQGKRYEAHVQAGGKKASNWLGVVIGVLVLMAYGGAFAAYVVGTGVDLRAVMDAQQSVDMGHGKEVCYSRGATRADAERVGEALKAEGFFKGEDPVTVLIAGRGEGKEISFVVGEGVWEKPGVVEAFKALTEKVAGAMGGKPVTLRLLNENGEEKKRVKVE